MKTIENLVKQLGEQLHSVLVKYRDNSIEFEAYGDKQNIDLDEFNKTTINIQNAFKEMAPALSYIKSQHDSVLSVCDHYSHFIMRLKKINESQNVDRKEENGTDREIN